MLSNTRCPVCASTFAVAPETLALAGGWVRCGRCSNIFESGSHKLEDTQPQQPQNSRAPSTTSGGPTPPQIIVATSIQSNSEQASQHGSSPRACRTALGRTAATAFLLVALCMQAVLAYRTEAATHYPSLRPLLFGMCGWMGCEIAPLAAPDQLTVESTGFQLLESPSAGASHQFSWHLRNLALYPIKAPALELSLTDALDRPILRKVLLARDLGLPTEVLEAEGRWVGEVPVKVTLPAGAPAIAGYRVIAFYP